MVSDANSAFLLISIPIIPLYIIIISRMLKTGRRSFQTTFYSAVLGMVIIDICSIFLNIIALSSTEFTFMKEFFWNSRRSYLSVLCYAQLFFFLFAKAFAHILFAGERFVHNFLKGTQFYKTIAPSFLSVFTMAAWISALVVAWHIFIQSDISFIDESLQFDVPSTSFNFYITLYALSTANVIILVFDIMILASDMLTDIPQTQRIQDTIQLISAFPMMFLLAYLCYHGYQNNINQNIFAIDSLFYVLCAINSAIIGPILLFDSKIRNSIFGQALDE